MDYNTKTLVAIEGFLRNTSYIDAPFMAKGSIITRQFFPNPEMRFVRDLDWVCLKHIEDIGKSGVFFSNWLINVTENNCDEKVWFRSFRDNNFWRRIDYAMDDDFPTTNTDLYCIINDNGVNEGFDDLNLDISFNLEIDFRPEKLFYQPLFGKPFKLEKICPYCLQVSWKLHQLLVRPRLKDVFDLIFLLRHERFCESELEKILYALKKECKRDGVNVEELVDYMTPKSILMNVEVLSERDYTHFTSKEYFSYKRYSEILLVFRQQLINCGFTEKNISS